MTDSQRGKPAPQSNWPRGYLLSIYAAAVANGHVVLSPISEPAARSLTQTFYNLRRRSRPGEANASFIQPEYHLVTVGKWSPDNGGTLPIMYSSTPDGLPAISVVADAEHFSSQAPAAPASTAPPTDDDILDDLAAEPPLDVDDYLAKLLADSHKKSAP